MKFETKFSIGDTVFFMSHNIVEKGVVIGIEVSVSDAFEGVVEVKEKSLIINIQYVLNTEPDWLLISENNLFSSKEELLKSL